MSQKLRQIMLAAAEDPATLRELRDDTQALADRFGLSPDEHDRLAQAEQLAPRTPGGLALSTITLHTITITGGFGW
ncbi:hypothetical protein FHS39_001554 [Streptomyces olivoverticillatus]|uniref:Uncharacterized protein n=1 Tax=Streptomyces olivoverticillatus TaxID=66427 RepID=A0A7W7LMR1_9ACTN|nr:hypothetical protein [Streptomyces olivoverticillatus]MBB4892543.1 hypothetical protein [Streptomyces olivoverticillatus]